MGIKMSCEVLVMNRKMIKKIEILLSTAHNFSLLVISPSLKRHLPKRSPSILTSKVQNKKELIVKNTMRMVEFTRVWSKMGKETDKELSIIVMEDTMRVSGKTTKWTGLAACIMSRENLLIKVNGFEMSSMGEEKSTTIIHRNWLKLLITKILKIKTSTGNIMKVFTYLFRGSILWYEGRSWQACLIEWRVLYWRI